MARKLQTIKIDNKEIVVRELTMNEIIENSQLLVQMADDGLNMKNFKEVLDLVVKLCLEGVEPSDILELTFSEAEKIWNTFKEVNKSFFGLYSGAKDLLKDLGLMELFKSLIAKVFNEEISGSTSGTPADS